MARATSIKNRIALAFQLWLRRPVMTFRTLYDLRFSLQNRKAIVFCIHGRNP